MEEKEGRQTDFLLFLKGQSCVYVAKRSDVQFLLEKSAKLQQTGFWQWARILFLGGNYPGASAMPNLNSNYVTGLRSRAYSRAALTLIKV